MEHCEYLKDFAVPERTSDLSLINTLVFSVKQLVTVGMPRNLTTEKNFP
jgi:hypothetical protein